MKTFFAFICFVSIFSFAPAQAQFNSATLQASGLTCALCTRAINKALEGLPFVASVSPDIKTSSFQIVFKNNSQVDIDAIRKGVEDAGFSVAKLRLKGQFSRLNIKNDEHVDINGHQFHFLQVTNRQLDGEQTLTIVDKNFLQPKEFKKYSAATRMKCVQTGYAGDCCQKTGIRANTRIYHVTI
ncbi:MAG: heavy-metal-associated domain-containing protein [Flavihumibacter sp.]